MVPLAAAPAAAEQVALDPLPPIANARAAAAAAPPCPALGMVQVGGPPLSPPASVHGGGGLALFAPLAMKVESDKELLQLPSKAAVAAASTAAGAPPTTVPTTPVVTATGLPTIVPVQSSAVARRAVKSELHDIGRAQVAGLAPSTAAAAELIVIDINDDESAGASAGVGCDLEGGGRLQPGGTRLKGAGINVARVKEEVYVELGAAAAAAAAAARAPVVAGAAPGVGAVETEATVAEQALGGQQYQGLTLQVQLVRLRVERIGMPLGGLQKVASMGGMIQHQEGLRVV